MMKDIERIHQRLWDEADKNNKPASTYKDGYLDALNLFFCALELHFVGPEAPVNPVPGTSFEGSDLMSGEGK